MNKFSKAKQMIPALPKIHTNLKTSKRLSIFLRILWDFVNPLFLDIFFRNLKNLQLFSPNTYVYWYDRIFWVQRDPWGLWSPPLKWMTHPGLNPWSRHYKHPALTNCVVIKCRKYWNQIERDTFFLNNKLLHLETSKFPFRCSYKFISFFPKNTA